MTETSAFFDYDALDDQTRDLVEQRTVEIKRLTKRVAKDVVEIESSSIITKRNQKHVHNQSLRAR